MAHKWLSQLHLQQPCNLSVLLRSLIFFRIHRWQGPKLLKSDFLSPILSASGVMVREPVDGDADMMSRKTYFHQECPTCGRTLQVRVEYLGRQMTCQHCGAQFEACDPASGTCPPNESGIALLRRAEELLNAAESGIFKVSSTGSIR
jgi:hypothetical protein